MYFSPLNQYISRFQNHVAWANIKDSNVLIGYFLVGILPSLMWHIMLMDTVPSTIQEWYSKAIHFQTQWEWAKEITKRNQCPTQHPYQSFNPNTLKVKDPNAMDVDMCWETHPWWKEALYWERTLLSLPESRSPQQRMPLLSKQETQSTSQMGS